MYALMIGSSLLQTSFLDAGFGIMKANARMAHYFLVIFSGNYCLDAFVIGSSTSILDAGFDLLGAIRFMDRPMAHKFSCQMT